jgi:hypothetical protein
MRGYGTVESAWGTRRPTKEKPTAFRIHVAIETFEDLVLALPGNEKGSVE